MPEREAVRVHATAERCDDHLRLTLAMTLPPGVHVEPHEPTEPNLVPTVLHVEGLQDVTVAYPPPVVKDLGWNGITLTVLEGAIEFRITGRLLPSSDRVTGTVTFQPCVGGACLPPRTVGWEAATTGATEYSILHALAA